MNLNKIEFTGLMSRWLKDYLVRSYSEKYTVEVIIPGSNLSKLANLSIKSIENYYSYEFAPDVLGILTDNETKKTELVFLNRSLNAISLKEIGELYCYSKIANPILSFIVSLKGLPKEVNLILLNKEIQDKLLNYVPKRNIIFFRWDAENEEIDSKSVFPISERNGLNK